MGVLQITISAQGTFSQKLNIKNTKKGNKESESGSCLIKKCIKHMVFRCVRAHTVKGAKKNENAANEHQIKKGHE